MEGWTVVYPNNFKANWLQLTSSEMRTQRHRLSAYSRLSPVGLLLERLSRTA